MENKFDLHDRFSKRNFEICRAVDLTNLGCVLDKMIDEGSLLKEEAKAFMDNASSLRALLVSKNNQRYAKIIPKGMCSTLDQYH
jgi:polyhydroxyalkanoate synthesis regulator phasin